MTKNCKNCRKDFEIAEEDLVFYEEVSPEIGAKKFAVPPPTHCPDCRYLRRLLWRNESVLYKRKCDATGKEFLSPYSPDKDFPVYDADYWWGDDWDPMQYGRDFDFNRSFFEQFDELWRSVPQLGRSVTGNENSDYTNQCGWGKNCYMIFEADYNEDCLYCGHIYESKSCVDNMYITESELCYECISCQKSYNLRYSDSSFNCSDSWFLRDCVGCRNCFGCVNLRNKEFYFFNEKCTEEEYKAKLKELDLTSMEGIRAISEKFEEFALKFPRKSLSGVQNEHSTGNYLSNTQNCHECYDTNYSQDCKFVVDSRNCKKVYDMTVFGSKEGAEFCCDSHEIGAGVRNVLFSDQVWLGCYNVMYSKLCMNNSHDLLGCVGLKQKSYCIFNKQYSKDEYEDLAAKIVEHMQKTDEWGEFLPMSLAPYAYNETLAMDYFPISEEEAVSQGHRWKEKDEKEYRKSDYVVPDCIDDVPDSIVDEVLACEQCGRNYKIIQQELDFHRKQKLPFTRQCFYCRHRARFDKRTPRRTWERKCDKCGVDLRSSYEPERPEQVYCEECYLKEVY